MASISNSFRSLWHSLTSYDRHASHDSPYRTGKHVPLSQSRHAPLTSVATSASESRPDVSSPYDESTSALTGPNGFSHSPVPPSPYSPGMRSTTALQRSNTHDNFESVTPGEIQLQAFQEGLPPAPPVAHSWKRIDSWAEDNYPELFDQLGEGVTYNDLNELEHELDCSLPMDVRESLMVHDGQERGGRPTGIIFSSMLLDCEEIVQEWNNWKIVNQEYLLEQVSFKPQTPSKALGGASSSSRPPAESRQNPYWRQELLNRQDAQPPNAIQKAYAHPGWIPLARDWGGNNLAVDLAPGPTGKWGQIILFGRDYDCKYVVARSWAAFLATVADDLNSGKWFVDEDTMELKLREFKTTKVEPGYLDILRWRTDQKYGRRMPKRPPPRPKGSSREGSPSQSPYASPSAEVGEPRGRSMQRFAGASPVSSPNRPNYGKPSPLARVAEELPPPKKAVDENLMEVNTPRESADDERKKALETPLQPVSLTDETAAATVPEPAGNLTGLGLVNGAAPVEKDDENGMKTIEI